MKNFNFKTICFKAGANTAKEEGYCITEIITLLVMFPLMLLKLVNPKGEIDSKSAFILDDTPDIRTGRRIENISIVHDHVRHLQKNNKPAFGLFCAMLHCHIPYIAQLCSGYVASPSTKYPQNLCLVIFFQMPKWKRKNSNGDKRRQECTEQKNTNGLAMIKRDKRNYEYQGEKINFKQLVAKLKKEKKKAAVAGGIHDILK